MKVGKVALEPRPETRGMPLNWLAPAPKMISIAKKNATIEKSHARFRVATIENLPFEDSSFDCALSSLMIHHLPPDLKLTGLTEVYRVLRPGGRLLAIDIYRPVNLLW